MVQETAAGASDLQSAFQCRNS